MAKRVMVYVEGTLPIWDTEISPAETPEQAAERILGTFGFEIEAAEEQWDQENEPDEHLERRLAFVQNASNN